MRSFARWRTALDTQTQHAEGQDASAAAGLSDNYWALRELLTYNAAITSKIL